MSYYNAGHSSYGANTQLASVSSLRCTFCNEVTTHAPPGFNSQKKHVSCKSCTLGSNKSMRCMTCTKHMPLEQFAKSQRKNADRARCLKCMKKREEEDVWASQSDSDDSDQGKWDDYL
ncbi:hypothetical protein [Absidia glauca]|uniref:Stc1 domain-containing protein n=1 Tax=Absidia glauca TaxID=4829 RepID=A0A168PWZ5_ABSGL|nr:hypothetical protein [Absidia glauca]